MEKIFWSPPRFKVILSKILIVLFIFFSLLLPASAQQAPGFDPTFRSGDRREELLDEKKDRVPKPTLTTPKPDSSRTPAEQATPLGPSIRILVNKIRTIGNQTFSDEELAVITTPFKNQKLDYKDLERVRRLLTRHYIEHGYVNSGAVLPDQTISDGVVTFLIVEGRLSEVSVTGNRWLRDNYYLRRIRLSSGPPLNVHPLEQRLQMLQQHTLVRRLQAELKPGQEPGLSVLTMKVEENSPFNAWAAFNNYQSPSVGAERGLVTLTHRSLTGNGDQLSLTYGRSRGLDPLFDVSYRLPLTSLDTELSARYRINDFDIIEEPFQSLDIDSESDIFEIKLRQPVWRTPSHELALSLIGERLHSRSWLGGNGFSFSPGTVDGEATVEAFRFSQEYLYRSQQIVVAAHSRFSWGVDAIDATIHESDIPDSRFFAWLGQVQWAGIISPYRIQAIWRTDVQLADDALLALEQMPVGGRYSVRGYRENLLVRDNAVVTSLETRIPLVQQTGWADYLQLAPFFDYGQTWYTDADTPDPQRIYSIGLGLRWALTFLKAPFPITTELEVYWGYALEEVATGGNTLQDDGIHLQIAVSAF